VLSLVYPIGSVFTAVVSTNPNTLFGFGTWAAIATGRVLIGIDTGDTDFDVVEETGGAKTKTIAQENLPNISTGAGTSHNHTQDAHTHTQNSHNHTQDAHLHTLEFTTTATGSATKKTGTNDTSATGENVGSTTATNQATTATNQNTTATNQAEAAHTHSLGGSGTALNVVNPYYVVYFWKRTA